MFRKWLLAQAADDIRAAPENPPFIGDEYD